MNAPGPSRVWANRDFRTLLVGETVSEFGNTVGSFGLPLAVLFATDSAFASGAVVAAGAVGSIGFSLIGGALADGHSRRAMMLWTSAGRALAWLGLAAIVTVNGVHVAWAMLIALVGGACASLYGAAQAGALRTMLAPPDYPRAVATIEGRNAAVDLVGAPLGGILLGLGVAVPLIANAASFAVSALAISSLRTPLGAPGGRPAVAFWEEVRRGYSYVWSRLPYRIITLASAASNFGVNAFLFALVLVLQAAHHPPWQIGLVQTGIALSILGGAFLSGPLMDRLRIATTVRSAAVLRVAALVGVAVSWEAVPIAVGLLTAGFVLTAASNTAERTYMALTTGHEQQGRVASFEQFVGQGFLPLAPLCAGALVEIWAPTVVLTTLSCVAAVGALVLVSSAEVGALPLMKDLVASD